EANELVVFPTGAGSNLYVNASSNGAEYVKAFCDLDDDGEFSAATDILLVRHIPPGAVAHIDLVFGDVDGDGVSDEQERSDRTDPYSSKNFKFSETKVSYTDVDHGHGYTNIIALSQTPDGWDSNEAMAMFSSATFTNVVTATVTNSAVYVKCLRDLDGDGELDVGEEQMVVTILTAANNGKVTSVTIGDYDGDGVPDSQEILDGTNPHNAKNFRVRRWIDVATSDPVVSCTNYLAASPLQSGWQPTAVVTSFVCTSASVYIEETATNGFVYVKCLRDFNHDGSYDEADDVLYTVSLTARSDNRHVIGVGDHDGDGVFDSEEVAEETNPKNGMDYCMSLNATVAGIFTPPNGLSVVAYFGETANVLYGPCVQSNATLTVDFGHLSTTSRGKVSFMFWEDVNVNGIRDADERKTVCGFRVSGHSMCTTNVLELGDFDADGDGMLDDWEVAHGLSPSNAADAVHDADGDGFINLYEYISGTDPNDASDNGEGTALYAATHGVDDRIAIASTSTSVSGPFYANYPWEGNGVTDDIHNVSFVYNTNCWMHGVDMTCVSVWEDSPPGEWRIAYTAITPQHVISATHVSLQNGVRMTFQTQAGEVIVRTLVAQTFVPGVADNDFWIGLLDTPLPPSIKPARFLPPYYARHIGLGRKLPLVRIGRDKTCNIQDIIYLAPSERNQRMCCLQYSANASRFNYRRGPLRMDSGHPMFLLFDNELAFVCPTRGFYFSDNQATGFLCAYYKRLIQRVIDGLSLQAGQEPMTIEDFDLSEYLVYEGTGGTP
ncbi:MAG: hypothetical protein IKO72_14070, partial [Kiritimatiellae bacterium]|nr:hypothetical protein [Kiritimatiellia bacterium]